MIEEYFKYYRDQNGYSVRKLQIAIMNYDFKNYARDIKIVYNAWKQTTCKFASQIIYSNGSTSEDDVYKVGPYFGAWVYFVESILRKRSVYNIALDHALSDWRLM